MEMFSHQERVLVKDPRVLVKRPLQPPLSPYMHHTLLTCSFRGTSETSPSRSERLLALSETEIQNQNQNRESPMTLLNTIPSKDYTQEHISESLPLQKA